MPALAYLATKPSAKTDEIAKAIQDAQGEFTANGDGTVIVKTSEATFYFDKDLPLLRRIRPSASIMRRLLRGDNAVLALGDLGPEAKGQLADRLSQISLTTDTSKINDSTPIEIAMYVTAELADGKDTKTIESRNDPFSRLSPAEKQVRHLEMHQNAIPTMAQPNGFDKLQKDVTERSNLSEGLEGYSTRYFWTPVSPVLRANLAKTGAEILEKLVRDQTQAVEQELRPDIKRWEQPASSLFALKGQALLGKAFDDLYPFATPAEERWRGATVKSVRSRFMIYAPVQGPPGTTPGMGGVQIWP